MNGYDKSDDIFLDFFTSDNSKNVMYVTVVAHAKGGELAKVADVVIKVPETETYMIQELHLPLYRTLCLMLED